MDTMNTLTFILKTAGVENTMEATIHSPKRRNGGAPITYSCDVQLGLPGALLPIEGETPADALSNAALFVGAYVNGLRKADTEVSWAE